MNVANEPTWVRDVLQRYKNSPPEEYLRVSLRLAEARFGRDHIEVANHCAVLLEFLKARGKRGEVVELKARIEQISESNRGLLR